MNGQLLREERKFLHDKIANDSPKVVLEVGTWRGGGSTWQIASALRKNAESRGHWGHLYTCEINDEFYNEASAIYDDPQWKSFVTCIKKPSTEVIEWLVTEDKVPDFVFFDGPNDAELNYTDFLLIDKHLKSGASFSCHDWDRVEHRDGDRIVVAEKSAKLRPYLESHSGWEIIEALTHPVSVGLVYAKKK